MITRQLQEAADDLADIESALIWLNNSLHPRAVLGKLPIARRAIPLRCPETPRCCAFSKTKEAPCKEPANGPEGLCINHWLGRFGHTYGGAYSFDAISGIYHCRRCPASWRYPTTGTPTHLVEQFKREAAAAIRQKCPAKVAASTPSLSPSK